MIQPTTRSGPGQPSAFPTTHWSVVLNAAADSESEARAALETLCCRYWYPLYAFARRQGRSHHDAEDCTQAFILRLLAHDGLARARAERGRFRTFLLTAFHNFLINEWQAARTVRHGGNVALVPLPFRTCDEQFAREPCDPGMDPAQAFNRSWAQDLIDRTIQDLRSEYGQSGRGDLFAVLSLLLWGDKAPPSRREQAERLGLQAHAFDVALFRLRQRFAEQLRANVAETVGAEGDVDSELRNLIAAVGAR